MIFFRFIFYQHTILHIFIDPHDFNVTHAQRTFGVLDKVLKGFLKLSIGQGFKNPMFGVICQHLSGPLSVSRRAEVCAVQVWE